MSGIYNPIVFYPAMFLIVLFAILAIKFKNIFYSLICSIGVFFLAGMFYYILGSEYNAVIQIAIYGVAVPVVLGLAVMFTNLKKDEKLETANPILKFTMFLFGGIFSLIILHLLLVSNINISENIGNTSVQVLSAFSHGIFVDYIWAFELLALILTIIVVGITLLDRENDKCKGGDK